MEYVIIFRHQVEWEYHGTLSLINESPVFFLYITRYKANSHHKHFKSIILSTKTAIEIVFVSHFKCTCLSNLFHIKCEMETEQFYPGMFSRL